MLERYKEEIAEMRHSGASIREIAARFSTDEETVQRYLIVAESIGPDEIRKAAITIVHGEKEGGADMAEAIGLLERAAATLWVRGGHNGFARDVERFLKRVSPKSGEHIADLVESIMKSQSQTERSQR